MNWTQEGITLIAAATAAAASLLGLGISIIAQWRSEGRTAYRAIIQDDLNQIGQSLHETMALSNLQLKADSPEIHKKRYAAAAEAATALKELRHRVRYSLWGLDRGIRELTRLPDWIGHARHSKESALEIYQMATSLCSTIDKSVMRAYNRGRAPSIIERNIVAFKTWRYRRCYNQFQERSKANKPDLHSKEGRLP